MLITIILSLAVYTCMVVSSKLRKPVAIIGSIIMTIYCIVGSIFPMDKLFVEYPIRVAVLNFIPCTAYLVGLAMFTPIKIFCNSKDNSLRNISEHPQEGPIPPPHKLPPELKRAVPIPPHEMHLPKPPKPPKPPHERQLKALKLYKKARHRKLHH